MPCMGFDGGMGFGDEAFKHVGCRLERSHLKRVRALLGTEVLGLMMCHQRRVHRSLASRCAPRAFDLCEEGACAPVLTPLAACQ